MHLSVGTHLLCALWNLGLLCPSSTSGCSVLAQDTMFRRLRGRDGAHGRWVTSGRLPGWSDTVDVEAFRDLRVGHPVLPGRDDAWHDLGREPAAAAHVLATLTLGDECRARSLANHLPLRRGDDRENVGDLSLIHISEPTRLLSISYAVFCLKK